MFEEMPTERVNKLLAVRPLGFSKIRLLPKKQGLRMIMNLKRRPQVTRYGTATLGKSINSIMTPVFNAITYERVSKDDRMQIDGADLSRVFNLTNSARRCSQ